MNKFRFFGLAASALIFVIIIYHCFKVVNTIPHYAGFATIITDEVNLKESPLSSSRTILKLKHGEKFQLIEKRQDNWCKIIWGKDSAYLRSESLVFSKELLYNEIVRKYDDSPLTRFSILTSSTILFTVWCVFLFKKDKRKSMFEIALEYYFADQNDKALAYFKRVLDSDDGNARANYFAGMLEQDNSISIAFLEKSIGGLNEKETKSAKELLHAKYILLGTTYLEDGHVEKSIFFFNKGLNFNIRLNNPKFYELSADLLRSKGINDLAKTFYELGGLPIPDDVLRSEKILQPKQKPSKVTLSTSYFRTISDISIDLVNISKTLIRDEAFVEKIKGCLTESTIDEYIPYCVLYDVCQALKALSLGKINKRGIETFSVVLISCKLLPNFDDWFGLGYEKVSRMYNDYKYESLAESMVEISQHKNPINVTVEGTNDNRVVQQYQSNFTLPLALKIIDHPLFNEYVDILNRCANILAKADNKLTKEREIALKEIEQIIHNPLPEQANNSVTISEVGENQTLSEILKELDSLVGLEGVKREVKSLVNYIRIQKEREKVGLKSSQVSYHCIFTGSPGTGKTTVARLVAKIYLHLGVLKKGHLVETDRSGLIAEYTGQTAIKVNKVVNSAIDGVLFIDEAYSLVGENQDDFGREAVAALIKRMEDDRDRLIVILTGYTTEMKTFIESNPGLKSRFNRYIEFVDYNPENMKSIFMLHCKKLDYTLSKEAEIKLSQILEVAYSVRDKTFGNGRFVRNLFEKALENQANRISSERQINKEILSTITSEDIREI